MSNNSQEIQKRRIFGIISHPDAGKTTLTEKLLLHGGAIREAGTVPDIWFWYLFHSQQECRLSFFSACQG